MKFKAFFACSALILAACSSSNDSADSTDQSSDAVKKCVQKEMCVRGDVWSSRKCRCVPAGVSCGSKTCASDEYCCSESCGICEREGAMCPAIACAK